MVKIRVQLFSTEKKLIQKNTQTGAYRRVLVKLPVDGSVQWLNRFLWICRSWLIKGDGKLGFLDCVSKGVL